MSNGFPKSPYLGLLGLSIVSLYSTLTRLTQVQRPHKYKGHVQAFVCARRYIGLPQEAISRGIDREAIEQGDNGSSVGHRK